MPLQWPYKDPEEILDYTLDWSNWLDGDTISESAWILPTGLLEASSSFTTTTTTVWLGSGVLNATYNIINQITTAGGRSSERTVRLAMRDK